MWRSMSNPRHCQPSSSNTLETAPRPQNSSISSGFLTVQSRLLRSRVYHFVQFWTNLKYYLRFWTDSVQPPTIKKKYPTFSKPPLDTRKVPVSNGFDFKGARQAPLFKERSFSKWSASSATRKAVRPSGNPEVLIALGASSQTNRRFENSPHTFSLREQHNGEQERPQEIARSGKEKDG